MSRGGRSRPRGLEVDFRCCGVAQRKVVSWWLYREMTERLGSADEKTTGVSEDASE